MCCVLETGLTRNFTADLSLQILSNYYSRSLAKVWLEILVANLATNFQDLVAKVKNLVALAPVLGAILRPAVIKLLPLDFLNVQLYYIKFHQRIKALFMVCKYLH